MKKIEHLEMVDISKSFHGIPANDQIRISVRSGEILGLLGENGAGKTTLMNILYGLYQPDSGSININGKPVKIRSPLESIQLGIGMVHQHFMLVQNHTAGENIALGYKQTPFFFPQKKVNDSIVHFSRKFNFVIDPRKKVWQLSAGEQQRIEIIKALFNGAELLILAAERPLMSNIVYFDLETRRSFNDVGGSANLVKMGVSVACAFSTQVGKYELYREEELDGLVDIQCFVGV